MGLRGIYESLFPIIAPRLLGAQGAWGPSAIYTDGSKSEGLVGFGIFLDDRDSYRLRFPGHWCPGRGSHLMWASKKTIGPIDWQIMINFWNLFLDQAGLPTVYTFPLFPVAGIPAKARFLQIQKK
jgi:hypothetical protein